MNSFVRRAEIEREKAPLTAFLSSYLSPDANVARYEWLYCRNPDGKAWAWVASDAEGGEIKGVAAAFPRRIYSQGNEVRGYVLGDFCIHPEYRSLGPALALQRRSLEDLCEAGDGFVFDFPSESMLAIYKRLRIGTSEKMVRFGKPLRADRKMEQWLPTKMAARSLAVAANAGLRLRDLGRRRRHLWTIAEESAPCGEEFTAAARQWSRRMGICTARTAEYLNWRFLLHPQKRYHLLTARAAGKLCGYLIYEMTGEDATVADMLAEEDAACQALLMETIAEMRRHPVNTLSALLPSSHPARTIFEGCGFRAREASPVILLQISGGMKLENSSANHWYLTHGDRES